MFELGASHKAPRCTREEIDFGLALQTSSYSVAGRAFYSTFLRLYFFEDEVRGPARDPSDPSSLTATDLTAMTGYSARIGSALAATARADAVGQHWKSWRSGYSMGLSAVNVD